MKNDLVMHNQCVLQVSMICNLSQYVISKTVSDEKLKGVTMQALHLVEFKICDPNSLSWITIDTSTLHSGHQMGWGKCHSGCADFQKQYGNEICGRCGHDYSEHS
ncbi:MAG: hypothetical protein ABIR84_10090 [Candidatus Nitrotoga sp.]